ncbi:MAG TPA: hemerythrin domain-containing protein [Rhizomicrobium sp.]|jgi:hemerythrin-like domain-containing protein
MSLTGSIKKTAKKAQAAMAGEPRKEGDEGDILDTLKREHREVALLLEQLTQSESAPERRSLLKQIKEALIPHLRAEQKVVYDAVIALKDKDAKIDGEEGYIEHETAEKMLLKLEKMDSFTAPQFSAGAKVLKELVQHHVQEEEKNIWSDVQDNFSDDDRLEMNREFLAAKQKVRLH